MCICICICAYIYIHIYMYTYIYIYMHIHTYDYASRLEGHDSFICLHMTDSRVHELFLSVLLAA